MGGKLDDVQFNKLSNIFESSYDQLYTLLYPDINEIQGKIDVKVDNRKNNDWSGAVPTRYYKGSPYVALLWGSQDSKGRLGYNIHFSTAMVFLAVLYDIPVSNATWLPRGISLWSSWNNYSTHYWTEYVPNQWISNSIDNVLSSPFMGSVRIGTELIIEYLINRYGDTIIKEIGSAVKGGSSHLNALFAKTELPQNWLADFYEYLLTSGFMIDRITIHNQDIVNFWKGRITKDILINSATKTIQEVGKYRNLSAKLYNINLSDDLPANSDLTFTTEGGDAKISIFKYNDSNIELIDSKDKSVTYENIKNLSDQGYNLFALVTNQIPQENSNATTDITLTLELEDHDITITGCTIQLDAVKGTLIHEKGGVFITNWQFGLVFEKESPTASVTLSGNTLTQHFENYQNGNYTYSGTIVIYFNASQDTILSFSATQVNISPGQTWTATLEAKNIPINDNYNYNPPDLNYKVVGENACAQVTSISVRKEQTGFSPKILQNGSLVCSSGSEIDIYIHRE